MEEREKLTGYPSIDKPWLKYYPSGAINAALDYPKDKTLWDVIEEKLIEYQEIPAIEYFGNTISRSELRNLVYTWAKAFKALGVQEDDVLPIHGPFIPDFGAMALALNLIGATAYFVKLSITPENLSIETKNAKIAVAFDGMWDVVEAVFTDDHFSTVIIADIAENMPLAKRTALRLVNKNSIPKLRSGGKYLSLRQAKQLTYDGEIRASFVPNRDAFITSSSGTTIGGVVKGCVATNEGTIAQLYMATESGTLCGYGDRALNNLPPTASTSLNVLFFMALFRGATILMDPRVSEKAFYQQLTKLKPNFVLTTGSFWQTFFDQVELEVKHGKQFDFSCAKGWIVGGEGSPAEKYKRWNEILKSFGAEHGMLSGYGCSELFSAISVDTIFADSNQYNTRAVMGVGIPYVGITLGVFDNNGNELPCGRKGEMWIESPSAMKCYYNKPELTNNAIVNGWIHTGDCAEISVEGYIYIYGRLTDSIETFQGEKVFLFDVSSKINEHASVSESIVLSKDLGDGQNNLVAHIEFNQQTDTEAIEKALLEIDKMMKEYLPEGINMIGYAIHKKLPYSPTTLKKDKNLLAKQEDCFFHVVDGKTVPLYF